MNFPNDADGDALRRLAEHADLSKPMDIDFMVDVPTEQAGHYMALRASSRVYRASIECDEASQRWICYCTKRMIATYDAILAAQTELDILSEEFGGRTDGWGSFGNGA